MAMRYVLESIEARRLPEEIERRGIQPRQLVRVVVETLEDDAPLAKIAEEGRAFVFLADEPDTYSEADIKR